MIGYIPLLVAGPANIWRGIQRQTVLANIWHPHRPETNHQTRHIKTGRMLYYYIIL